MIRVDLTNYVDHALATGDVNELAGGIVKQIVGIPVDRKGGNDAVHGSGRVVNQQSSWAATTNKEAMVGFVQKDREV